MNKYMINFDPVLLGARGGKVGRHKRSTWSTWSKRGTRSKRGTSGEKREWVGTVFIKGRVRGGLQETLCERRGGQVVKRRSAALSDPEFDYP